MLFHLFAFLIVAAFASFISGYAFELTALEGLAELFLVGGTLCLTAAYASIFLALTLYGLSEALNGIRCYLSEPEARKRKVLFNQVRLMDLERRHRLERQQIEYRLSHRRKQLSRHNNKKHVRALADSIKGNLAGLQGSMSAGTYRSFERAVKENYRAENVEGLLKLHFEIMSFR